MTHFRLFLGILTTCALAACGSTAASSSSTDDAGSTDVGDTTSSSAIFGVFASGVGGYEEITATTWNEMAIVQLDAGKRFAITQNSATDKYGPSQFNKLVWTAPQNGVFYYCTVDYGLATADLASATTKTADDASPDTKGCGGFPWTKLTATAPLAVVGKYKDNFGGAPVITNRFWEVGWIVNYDNTKRFAITQSPADDKYAPNKFTKLVWTEPSAGGLYICTVAYGKDTQAAAESATETADSAAPEKSGCAGFAWTKLTPQ